jgi:cell division transport system permease protein
MTAQKSLKEQSIQILKLSISNIFRNKFLSIATIFIIAIIIFILNVILGVNQITQTSLDALNNKVDITVYIKEMATEDHITNLISNLKKIEEIKEIKYTTKTEALKKIQILHPDITDTFKKYDINNPLPRSLSITTKQPSDHKIVAKTLNKDEYKPVLSSINSSNQENSILNSVSQNLEKITIFTNNIIFWVILVFIFGGTLIITNSIQITIFNRKEEINVMKFLGGSHMLIKIPFILEAIFYGLISVLLSVIMIKIASISIDLNIKEYYEDLNFLKIITIETISLIVIAIISASIAVHKQLQRKL